MAKGFPYFKFIATEWLTGDIVFEDFELQGLFINICALYWHRDGELTIEEIQKRLKSERIAELTDRFFSVSDGFISVKFLDEQLIEANHISKINSENGKKGGRPKAAKTLEEKPTANRPLTDRIAKKSKEEGEEELKKSKEELNKKENNIELLRNRAQEFTEILEPFLDKYGREMLNAFYSYWTEPNKSKTKMRFEMEKTWDVERRLNTWASRENQQNKQQSTGKDISDYLKMAGHE